MQVSGLGALRVSFNYAATADAVQELLTHDYYLGGHLLLLWGTHEPYGVLALVRLPGGDEPPAAALAALAAVAGYVQRSYQPAGLVCEALPLDAPVVLDGRSRCQWVHPSLEASFEELAQ